ncbi:unnamed protein product [Cochlearia groenlandica]
MGHMHVSLRSLLNVRLDIIGVVFGNGTITDSCCQDLVEEGKVCHDTLIKYIADRPSLIKNETQFLKKRDDLWAHCVSLYNCINCVSHIKLVNTKYSVITEYFEPRMAMHIYL